MPNHLLQVVQAFETIYSSISSEKNNLKSNDVLFTVTPLLKELNFEVE